MQLTFLGGAQTVTGSRFLVTTERASVLVDCGMFQGSPNESIRNRVPLGFDPKALDAILVTHAHLDHCGLLPVAVREGYSGPIYLTSATAELVELVLLDSGRLQEEFAKRRARWERRHPDKALAEDREDAEAFRAALDDIETANERADAGDGDDEHVPTQIEPEPPSDFDPEADLRAQPPELLVDLDTPLYTERDAKAVPPLFRRIRYGRETEVAPGVWATYLDAGHILGSAIIRLRVRDDGRDTEQSIVFSGDLGRPDTPILRDPTPVAEADFLVVESTYGGREHEPAGEAVRVLADVVREVAAAEGVLLVPSFAIGRTQEIVWELDRMIDHGDIPLLPLYLDSPMATAATDIYRRHPEFYDAETKRILDTGGTPLDYPRQTVTRRTAESKAIERAKRPYMIVASNGMLTGGRVVAHLRNLIDDPKATLLFVGYQGQGTLGAHLQAGAKTVRIDGQVRTVRCRVRSISGLSAHADESELLDWIGRFAAGKTPDQPGYPRTVFLVHGDPDAQLEIAPKVEALGLRVHIPRWREQVELS